MDIENTTLVPAVKPSVWVVQDNGRFNLAMAAEFGEIKTLLPSRVQLQVDTESSVDLIKNKLKDYGDADCILAAGDPAAIGIACAVAAAMNDGYVAILKYDRQSNKYYRVQLDLGSMGWLETGYQNPDGN